MGTVTIVGDHYLREDAARSYLRMRRDGCPAGITSSSRSLELQTLYFQHQGEPNWPPKADHPSRSKHVWRPADTRDTGARALDLPDDGPRAWVREHGHRYGWIKDRVSREKWHMEYEPARDAVGAEEPPTRRAGALGLLGGTPPEPDLVGDDMRLITAPGRPPALVTFEGAYGYDDPAVAAIVGREVPRVDYTHDWQWDTDVREANARGAAMRELQTRHVLAALSSAGLLPSSVDERAIQEASDALLPVPPPISDGDLDVLADALTGRAVTRDDLREVITAVTWGGR